ncbi:MAG: RodZ domain-containing protein, partial [Acetobacteraceae bacterium]
RRFKAEAAEISNKTELAFPAPVPERGLPAGAVALLGIVLAVGVYAGWYRLSGEGRLPAENVPPVPARLAPLAEQVPTPAKPVVVASAPNPAPQPATPPASTAPTLQATVPPDQTVSPSSAAAATPVQPLATASTGQAADQQGLLVKASVDSWIQVRERGGQVLFSRILHAGESWPVPTTPNLLLTTGNAGGTELVVDGVPTAALGGMGVVRRDLPLDLDAIRSGKLAPLAAPAAPR